MNDVTYYKLVQETLLESWNKTEKSLPIKDEDWEVGITLFAKIALEFIERQNIGKLSDKKISNSTSSLDERIYKIKIFVQDHAEAFQIFCQTGLLSSSDKILTENSLKYVLGQDDKILSYMMTRTSHWMSEKELDKLFSFQIDNDVGEVVKSCFYLLHTYKKNADNRAGYYFLWLFNRYGECSFKMPRRRFFYNSSVTDVLTQFLEDKGCKANWEKVVEIMIYRESKACKSIFEEVLLEESFPLFFDLLPDLFENTPIFQWPNKLNILMNVLEILTNESRLVILKTMISSIDHDTATLGHYLYKVFNAKSLKKVIPNLEALKMRFPNIYEFAFRLISQHSLLEFKYGKANRQEACIRLSFNGLRMKSVFIQGSLMIGVQTFKHLTYLNAYDMHSEKRIWTIPLIMGDDKNTLINDFPKIKQVGDFLVFQFIREKKLHFINAETGEFEFELKLPAASINNFESMHISSTGNIYQMVHDGPHRKLIGGRLQKNKWIPSFELKAPNGFLRPFSTHCGFQSFDKLLVCGPTGHLATIEGCNEAHVMDDKLIAIENDPLNKSGRLLTIRTLKLDKDVISPIETKIPINIRKITFGNISYDKQHIVLFSKNISDTSPIFIDLETDTENVKVTYSTTKFYSHEEHMINPLTGELWVFDQASKSVWKISAESKKLMTYLNYSRGTSFLHVDKNDHLYYIVNKKPSTLSGDGKRLNMKDKQQPLKSIHIT